MVIVKVTEGMLEGEILENVLGGQYYSFKGIPYAPPPVDDLRFKAPAPPKPWQGIRSAKCHGSICHQIDIFSREIIDGSEDCLYLNVYTPELVPEKPFPVMVYIHGGGFMSGSGNSEHLGPEFLLKQGVILVTINYRLEVFGFLCLDTEDVPGNAGMKDQVAALRWVKNNIVSFGGEPDNITIFGESAGAASVTYHLVSPMSKGLFKRAIVQSGCLLNRWAFTLHPRQRAENFARQLGKNTSDDKELYEFFKSLPKDKLVGIHAPISAEEAEYLYIQIPFAVVSEKQFGKSEYFFCDDPTNLACKTVHEGVSVMAGYTKHDGIICLRLIADLWNKFNNMNESVMPTPLSLMCNNKTKIEIGRVLKGYHFGKQNITKDCLLDLIDYQTMLTIAYDTITWSKLCTATNSKIYFYEFAAVTERNVATDDMFKLNLGNGVWCAHCDDLFYIFNVANVPVDETSNSFEMIKVTTKLWTNFAKFGNPTPDNELNVIWPAYDLKNQWYLSIDEDLKVASGPLKDRVDFWDNLCEQYLSCRNTTSTSNNITKNKQEMC